jgi:hypothetical protein
MLILLPFLTFVGAFLILAAIQTARAETSSRLAFLQAAGFVAAYLVLSVELLSLFGALTRTGMVLSWLVGLAAVFAVGWRHGWLSIGLKVTVQSIRSLGRFEIVSIAAFTVIIGLLFLVAILSPPNNTDSLLYHMSRVTHWAQNQSLRHYATGFSPQLVNPIFAETAILNLRLLWGDDQLANLVQWLSMIGSLIGVSLTAKILGAGRRGQWVAAAFAISIPMGLMQATSTQNDYVVAFWLISLICFASLRALRPPGRIERLSFGIALGLGLLTKGTYYPYAAPIVLWYLVYEVRDAGWRLTAARGLWIAIPVLILNLGYWTRNILTFSGPLGSSDWVDSMTFQAGTPLAVIAAMVRNTAMHFVSPYEEMNVRIAQMLQSALGPYDQNLVNLKLTWGWNHEDLAANPLHLTLVAASVVSLVLARGRLRDRVLLEYSVVTLSLYVMLALVVKFDPWGIRYQLPYWVLWAPVFGVVLSKLGGRQVSSVTIFVLLLTALPWTLFNRSRPLIAMRNRDEPEPFTIPCDWHFGCTIGSVLVEPPATMIFANAMSFRDPYLELAKGLEASGCNEVGLRIDSHDREYLFWWLLDAPQSGIRIESVYPLPELEHLADPDFRPCAVICTICGDRSEIHGLPLKDDYGEVKLYVGDGYVPTAY